MEQYLNLLKEIKEKGTWKSPARSGMPRTLSLFGAQYRCNLQDGFPILTTKKVSFKNIAVELIWFLRGDTNIKYLVDNGCNIWNEDSYQYYQKLCKKYDINCITFDQFISRVKDETLGFDHLKPYDYKFGDCGWQYGKLWRNWEYLKKVEPKYSETTIIDQISELISGLKNNPESRRHILTALNPAHYNDLALFPCHVMAQFNAMPLNTTQRIEQIKDSAIRMTCYSFSKDELENSKYFYETPKYYLDCHMYQRSADVFLGVPYNTASYALLTHILSEICGMIPGDLIHSFGDVHIYENHMEQVDEQLSRITTELPKLNIKSDFKSYLNEFGLDELFNSISINLFELEGYNHQPSIKGKLSTGLQ